MKLLRSVLLLMALSVPAFAGDIPFPPGVTPPPPQGNATTSIVLLIVDLIT